MAGRARVDIAAALPEGRAAERTRARILDGALRAIARHGLTKLGMSDVSASAGVSRGTLYRYFPSREELLENLARFEAERFQRRVGEALRSAPPGAPRLELALQHVTRYAREQPAIQRLLDTEPAFVLTYVRENFPALCATTREMLAPLLRPSSAVQTGAVGADQLVDWLTRVMISAVLFPDPDPDGMARGLTAVYRVLTGPPPSPAPPARASRRPSTRQRIEKERRR